MQERLIFTRDRLWLMARTALAIAGLAVIPQMAKAQYKAGYEMYSDRIQKAGLINAGDSSIVGDQVSLHDGALSFSAKDVVLEGKAGPISIGRNYSAFNRRYLGNVGVLGDWELDIPRIEGVFAPNWSGRLSATDPNRCSNPGPYPIAEFSPSEWWSGLSLHLTDEAGGGPLLQPTPSTQKPTNGVTYPMMSSGWSYVSCLPNILNGSGQGFKVISPSGTTYWFQWLAQYVLPGTAKRSGDGGGAPAKYHLLKRKNVMYVTRIEDQFGNYITYNYSNSYNQPVRLNSISASDGRVVNIGYNASGLVSSVSLNGRTWSYGYGTTAGGRATLSSITQPDGSAWQFSLANVTDAEVIYLEYANENSCDYLGMPNNAAQEYVGSITHPSGATGSFTVKVSAYNRSNVPISCQNVTGNTPYPSSQGNNPADDVNMWPLGYWGLALVSKSLSGPGLSGLTWTYQYSSDATAYYAGNATWEFPVCTQGLSCGQPRCVTDACAGTARTTVTAPNGSWTRYVHGNSFKYNDGKLLSIETGAVGSTNVLRRTAYTYDFRGVTNRGYLHLIGWALKAEDDGYMEQLALPTITTQIIQDGVNFNRSVSSFDHYANPTTVQKYSSLGYTKTDVTEYFHDTSKWVLGQVKRVYNANTGAVMSRTEFHPSTALPYQIFTFEKLQQTLSYNTDGTLATSADGRGNITTFSNWKRGIPQNMQFADGTTQAAIVDDNGWIRAVTDENGYSTGYGYDNMGRVAGITYPQEDSFAYNNTVRDFRKTAGEWAPPGIVVGQWRLQEITGNHSKITYMDALLRPVLVMEYDTANVASTVSYKAMKYDADGRQIFSSYPERNVSASGIRTTYDPLGRVITVKQDSEHGALTSTTVYLNNFEVRTTNPRGYQSVNGYQAFDEPTYENVAWSAQPENKTIEIVRDLFGKPTSLTQRAQDNSVSVTRRYVYRAEGQTLCKTIEPETGATIMDVDAAGNLGWSASGVYAPNPSSCDLNLGWSSGRRTDRVYDTRNRLTALSFPDGRGNQTLEYWPDGLQKKVTTYNDSNAGSPVVNDYVYNRRRLLAGESSIQPGWYSFGVGYGYDANGHLSTQGHNQTGAMSYFSPNALGQATQLVSNTGTFATGVSYYANGAISQFTYGNGIVHTMQQNARQLPVRSTDNGVINYSFSYDPNGNPNAIYDDLQGAHYSRWMSYDGLDRLTDAGSCSFGGDCWHRIRYDALDNITSNKLPGVKDYASYIYNTSNRLTQVNDTAGNAAVSLAYDPQGNLSSKNGQGYQFDYGNRLRAVNNKETYRYDGQGRRVLSWRYPSVRDGLIAEYGLSVYSLSGQLTFEHTERDWTEYYYLAGSVIGSRTYNFASNSTSRKFHHTDALGSPVAYTNEAAQVIERTQFEPYGAPIGKRVQGIGYTGHVMDAATGLTYMQQRYYDPNIGRFLSTDPVQANANTGASFNRYAYANNNPYKFTDPDGRQAKEAGRWIRALWDNNGDFDKAKAQVDRQHQRDLKMAETIVDFTPAGIVKDAVQVTNDALNGRDPLPQGSGAIAGEAAGQATERMLNGRIGSDAASVAGAAVGKVVSDAVESGVRGGAQPQAPAQTRQPSSVRERPAPPPNPERRNKAGDK